MMLAPLALSMAPVQGTGPDPDRFSGTAVSETRGNDVEINFSNPALANRTIQVFIHDGQTNEKTIKIKLDGKGNGKAKTVVPDWDVMILTEPSSQDHVIFVTERH